MPEIVEPKQLIQSRVLVKRARLTVKRGAARPNGKSKPPQSPLRRAVRYRIAINMILLWAGLVAKKLITIIIFEGMVDCQLNAFSF